MDLELKIKMEIYIKESLEMILGKELEKWFIKIVNNI